MQLSWGRFRARGTGDRAGIKRHLLCVTVLAFASVSLVQTKAAEREEMLFVDVQQGRLLGDMQRGLRVFRGIPFAAPPVGALRWRPPVGPKAWTGVREAKAFAPACVQMPNPVMNVPAQEVSEDCLYLNVWTPADDAGDRLPVLVWIHGGGFAFGSTAMPLFDGAALAKKGLVFVSITYRVGPLGFLAHPELSEESAHGVSGNYGLLDQVAALAWIGDNITAFGGDSGRVTIMGQSAGGMSVSLLVQSALASGLFSGAIAQSGASFVIADSNLRGLREAEQSGAQFALGIGASSLAELRALSATEIVEAAQGANTFPFRESWPIQDGYVVPDDPVRTYRQRRQNDVPTLIGNNEREGAFFPHPDTVADFRNFVKREFGDRSDSVLAAYPARNNGEAEKSAAALVGDRTFGIQNWTWARLQSSFGESPVFYYHFDHSPPRRDGIPPGAIHGAELPYVFGTFEIRPIEWTGADRAMSTQLMDYWANFVITGNPNGSGLTHWPPFSNDSPRVMYFSQGQSELGPVPHETRMKSFDQLEITDE